ncbi:MAG: PAS domain-containing protein [Rickettsiales bacterium]
MGDESRDSYTRRTYDPLVSETVTHLERRMNKRLFNYWNALRGTRRYPTEDELDPSHIDSLWSQCFLMQTRDIEKVRFYNYTYVGQVIVQAYNNGELTDKIPGMVSLDANHLAREFDEVIRTGQPKWLHGEHEIGSKLLLFEQCLLPLGAADGKVHSILGRLGFRFLK